MSPTREEMIKEVLELDPKDAMVHFTLGNLYLEEERFEEAIEVFRTAVELDPEYSAAWLGLGQAYKGQGDDDNARETFEKAVAVASEKRDLRVRNEARAELDALDEF